MGNTGIIFNCRGDYYSLVRGEANALEPGKRPRSTLQSTLVMKDGQPFMITRKSWRRRSGDAHDADINQRDRFRHEHSASHRSATVVHSQLPVFSVSAHHVSRRDGG